jgi:hypothetical protein
LPRRPQHSGGSPKLVFKFSHDAFDLSLGAPARVPVSTFEQDHEFGAGAVDSIEIVGTDFGPQVRDFISEVLPLCPENVVFHGLFPISG